MNYNFIGGNIECYRKPDVSYRFVNFAHHLEEKQPFIVYSVDSYTGDREITYKFGEPDKGSYICMLPLDEANKALLVTHKILTS